MSIRLLYIWWWSFRIMLTKMWVCVVPQNASPLRKKHCLFLIFAWHNILPKRLNITPLMSRYTASWLVFVHFGAFFLLFILLPYSPYKTRITAVACLWALILSFLTAPQACLQKKLDLSFLDCHIPTYFFTYNSLIPF